MSYAMTIDRNAQMVELSFEDIDFVGGGLEPIITVAIIAGAATVIAAGIAYMSATSTDDCTTTTYKSADGTMTVETKTCT